MLKKKIHSLVLYTNGKEASTQYSYHWGISSSYEEGVLKINLVKNQKHIVSNSKAFQKCSVPNSIIWPSGNATSCSTKPFSSEVPGHRLI